MLDSNKNKSIKVVKFEQYTKMRMNRILNEIDF